MAIEFRCTHCGAGFRVADKWAGKKAKCTRCGAVSQVPGLAPLQPSPSPRDLLEALDDPLFAGAMSAPPSGVRLAPLPRSDRQRLVLIGASIAGAVVILLAVVALAIVLRVPPGPAPNQPEETAAVQPNARVLSVSNASPAESTADR